MVDLDDDVSRHAAVITSTSIAVHVATVEGDISNDDRRDDGFVVRRGLSPVLVGRAAEVDRLDRALDGALDTSRVVLITGEAGSGKTRLVRELVERAGTRVAGVYVGRCIDLGAQVWPLAPLREMATKLLADLDETELGGSRDLIRRLAGSDHGAGRDGSPVMSDWLAQQVVGVFGRLSRRGPLVVVVEDLHWADDTTCTVFAALARSERVERLLLVGTFRPDELDRRHPLRPVLADVERQTTCERLAVPSLSVEATSQLITVITAQAVDREVAEQVHARSGGNPFFIEELVGASPLHASTVPATFRDAVLARTAPLDDAAHDLLGVVAAADAVTLDVVGDVTGLGQPEVRAAVDELCRLSLLTADGDELRFRHELAREVLHAELLPGQRSRIHAALAASLERRRPDRLGAAARHWMAAHDIDQAVRASVLAGRQALADGAAAEAEEHFERAIERWERVVNAPGVTGIDRVTLLLEAATAAEHARHVDRAIARDLQAIDELNGTDPFRAARIWLHLRELYRWHERFTDGTNATEHALGLLAAAAPSALLAVALAHGAHDASYAGRHALADERARRAVDVAEAVGDLESLVRAHYAAWVSAYQANDHERALTIAEANVARCATQRAASPCAQRTELSAPLALCAWARRRHDSSGPARGRAGALDRVGRRARIGDGDLLARSPLDARSLA